MDPRTKHKIGERITVLSADGKQKAQRQVLEVIKEGESVFYRLDGPVPGHSETGGRVHFSWVYHPMNVYAVTISGCPLMAAAVIVDESEECVRANFDAWKRQNALLAKSEISSVIYICQSQDGTPQAMHGLLGTKLGG